MKCIDCNGTGMFDDGSGERTMTRCQTCEGSGVTNEEFEVSGRIIDRSRLSEYTEDQVRASKGVRNVRFLDASDIDNIFRIMTASEDEKQPYKPRETKL